MLLGEALWQLGYADQGLHLARQALADAQELDHPFTSQAIYYDVLQLSHLTGLDQSLRVEWARTLARILPGVADPAYVTWVGALIQLWTGQSALDAPALKGLRRVHDGISAVYGCARCTDAFASFAEMCLVAGALEEGLAMVDEALAFAERTGEGIRKAELHRLKGVLLLRRREMGDEVAAEASFREAIAYARHQQAKSWELRATTDLARLLAGQGKREQAREMLAAIYGWFTEGFGTADLMAARALLEDLA
jgi:predicted ATPase